MTDHFPTGCAAISEDNKFLITLHGGPRDGRNETSTKNTYTFSIVRADIDEGRSPHGDLGKTGIYRMRMENDMAWVNLAGRYDYEWAGFTDNKILGG